MTRAVRHPIPLTLEPSADDRPTWRHLDELEGAPPAPREPERADVDALLRGIGEGPNPDLQPPRVAGVRLDRGLRRWIREAPGTILTVLGGASFLLGMVATMAVLETGHPEPPAADEAAGIFAKVVVERKPSVILELPVFTIAARLPDARPAHRMGAAHDGPPALAPEDAPPVISPLSDEPMRATRVERAAEVAIGAIAAKPSPEPGPIEAFAPDTQHALFSPPEPMSLP